MEKFKLQWEITTQALAPKKREKCLSTWLTTEMRPLTDMISFKLERYLILFLLTVNACKQF